MSHTERHGSHTGHAIAIRRATERDAPGLRELAVIDSAAALSGAALVAVVEGRIWAALEIDGGRAIADPFVPSAAAVELLRVRCAQLHAAPMPVRGGMLLRRALRRARA